MVGCFTQEQDISQGYAKEKLSNKACETATMAVPISHNLMDSLL